MEKLKCWKRTANFKNLINYSKKGSSDKIVIEKPDKGSDWRVTDEQGFRKASLSNSKTLAIKKAKSYMIKHNVC